MKFEDQSPEMQNTLLCASVGEVAIESHAFEHILRLIVCMAKSKTDAEFESEFKKRRTLGQLLSIDVCRGIFTESEMTVLNSAKNARNQFAHELSEFYISSINTGSNMFSLIEEFRTMKMIFEAAVKICQKHMEILAGSQGLNVEMFNAIAAERIGKWAHA